MDRQHALQELLTDIAFAVFVMDEEFRYVEAWSLREHELLLPIDETIGKRVGEVLPPSRAVEVEGLVRTALATGQLQRASFPVAGPTGVLHLTAGFAPFEAPEGRRVMVALTDFTEKEQLVRELRESERKYQSIFENAPDAIVVLDVSNGVFCDANGRAVELLGFGREALTERTLADVSPPTQPDGRASAEAAAGWLAQAIAGERPVFEWTYRTSSGLDLPCEVRLTRLPIAAGIQVRASLVDISARPAIEPDTDDCWARCRALVGQELAEIQGELTTLAQTVGVAGAAVRVSNSADKLARAIAVLLAELDGR